MKLWPLILILCAGCVANPPTSAIRPLPPAPDPRHFSLAEGVIAPDEWPTVTMCWCVNLAMDDGSPMGNGWTNSFALDLLVATNIALPMDQWQRIRRVPLIETNGQVAFVFATNLPNAFIRTALNPI